MSNRSKMVLVLIAVMIFSAFFIQAPAQAASLQAQTQVAGVEWQAGLLSPLGSHLTRTQAAEAARLTALAISYGKQPDKISAELSALISQ